MNEEGIVKFRASPLQEIIFEIHFASAREMLSLHQARFVQSLLGEFSSPVESHELPSWYPADATFQFTFLPPLRRILLQRNDGRATLQIQGNRLVFNGKKTNEHSAPSFEDFKDHFFRVWDQLQTLALAEKFGPLHPHRYQLSYINSIPLREGDSIGTYFSPFQPDFSLEGLNQFQSSWSKPVEPQSILSVSFNLLRTQEASSSQRSALLELSFSGSLQKQTPSSPPELLARFYEARRSLNQSFVSLLTKTASDLWR